MKNKYIIKCRGKSRCGGDIKPDEYKGCHHCDTPNFYINLNCRICVRYCIKDNKFKGLYDKEILFIIALLERGEMDERGNRR